VKTISDKVVRHTNVQSAKVIGGGLGDVSLCVKFKVNFRSNCPRWSEIADFLPIFARSASAVTPAKKVQH